MTALNEDRVFRHWRALKRRFASEGKNTKSNEIWLTLARVHKAPVRRIKDIVQARHTPHHPVWCCEAHCYVECYEPGPRHAETSE